MIVHIDDVSIPGGDTTIPMYRRVVYDRDLGSLRLATATDRSDGTLSREFVPEFNTDALVIPWHNGGTRMMIADGPIPAFGHYKNSADGKITLSDAASAKGRLMRDAATEDGAPVECSPYSNAD